MALWDHYKKFNDKHLNVHVMNLLGILSFALTVVSVVVMAIQSIWGLSFFSPFWLRIVSVGSLFGFVVWFVKKWIKYRSLSKGRLTVFSHSYQGVNYGLSRLLFSIDSKYEDHTLTRESLESLVFDDYVQSALNLLDGIMEIATGRKTSACLMLVSPPNEGLVESKLCLETALVFTRCRSAGTQPARLQQWQEARDNNKPYSPLSGNTDFREIFRGSRYFLSNDLQNHTNYETTSLNNVGEFYNSTLVVPIFLRGSTGQVIGFLCVDSESYSAFPERQHSENIAVLAGISQLLQIALREYKFHLRLLEDPAYMLSQTDAGISTKHPNTDLNPDKNAQLEGASCR